MHKKRYVKKQDSAFIILFALFISFCLMIIDAQYSYLRVLHQGLSTVLYPFQYAVDAPVRAFNSLHAHLHQQQYFLDENERLNIKQLKLQTQLQTFSLVKQENLQLKHLLSASNSLPSQNHNSMVANVLAVETNRARQLLVLNKGYSTGVHIGLPVFDAYGVMGQIIDVGRSSSTVMLVSDSKCAVPVMDERTGERAILVGTNNILHLSLINLPKTSMIRRGDRLVTSGLGPYYPEGFPVGEVAEVRSNPGDDFIQVNVSPVALLNRTRLVLLRWPEEETNLLMAKIHARLRVLEQGS